MKNIWIGAFAALLALTGVASAQSIVQPMHQNDLVPVLPYGAPSPQNFYAAPGSISAVTEYSYQVPVTAWAITPASGTGLLYLNTAGTLATGFLTMQASPSDGQTFCIEDSQTQTAITVTPNSGQTLTAGTYGLATPTSLTANVRDCWLFFAAQSAWVRTQ